MRVLAIDPGGTTGWAFWDAGSPGGAANGRLMLPREPTALWGQIPGGFERACDALVGSHDYEGAYLQAPGACGFPDVLVIERYSIQERTVKYSRQMDAPEIIGLLKGIAQLSEVKVVVQAPADAKRLFTDARLKEFGWYAKGEEHARDALRHLGFYLASKRLISLRPAVSLEGIRCPTCGPTSLEQHPQLGTVRCSNCKEHLS